MRREYKYFLVIAFESINLILIKKNYVTGVCNPACKVFPKFFTPGEEIMIARQNQNSLIELFQDTNNLVNILFTYAVDSVK